MSRSMVSALLAIVAVAVPHAVTAQTLWLEGAVARVTWRPVEMPSAGTLTGVTFGGAGAVGVGPVSLEAGYAEGRMAPAGASAPVLVEAFGVLRVRPVGGFSIGAGPYGRALVTAGETRRWLLWQLRGRYELTFIDNRLRGYAEVWSGLGGGGTTRPAGARGGSAGVVLRLTPLAFHLGYAIDGMRVDAAGTHETLERIRLAVRVGGS